MVITSAPKANVESDFLNLTKQMIKKEYSDVLLEQWKLGNLKFSVSKTLKKDGITSFGTDTPKKSTVTIKRSVAMSKHICWRLATLLHELAHALHYFYAKDDIYEEDIHGEDWMMKIKETIQRGGLKNCAKKLESPDPACLYKRNCVWCPPNGEKYSKSKEFILPKIHEKSNFGGNCLFCFTADSTIKHLKKSSSCKNKYVNIYGPQYEAKLSVKIAKEKRIDKRLANSSGQPVCRFCPIQGEWFLFVHLRANADCARKYMTDYKCQTYEELRKKISKEKAKLRKRKQRAKPQRDRD